MLTFLPPFIKGPIAALFFALNTLFWCLLLFPFAIVKFLVPIVSVRRAMTAAMAWIGEAWISVNSAEIALLHHLKWNITGLEGLSKDKSYLVISNHQSWVDIVALQHIFNRRIPFIRFFLKRELFFVPFLGLAWWALDFPFMKRHSKEYLARHPEKRGEDLETTRRACERFAGTKISVLNFLEGTRLTPSKHARQKSPFPHLLNPKAGGLAFVLEAMGQHFDALLDVSIYYRGGAVSLWGLFKGQLSEIDLHVRRIELPADLLRGRYLEDPAFRERFQSWVRELWTEKEQRLAALDGGV